MASALRSILLMLLAAPCAGQAPHLQDIPHAVTYDVEYSYAPNIISGEMHEAPAPLTPEEREALTIYSVPAGEWRYSTDGKGTHRLDREHLGVTEDGRIVENSRHTSVMSPEEEHVLTYNYRQAEHGWGLVLSPYRTSGPGKEAELEVPMSWAALTGMNLRERAPVVAGTGYRSEVETEKDPQGRNTVHRTIMTFGENTSVQEQKILRWQTIDGVDVPMEMEVRVSVNEEPVSEARVTVRDVTLDPEKVQRRLDPLKTETISRRNDAMDR